MDRTPRWLSFLERYIGWIAIPRIAVLLITLQALGFIFIQSDPVWLGRFELLPEAVLAGEYWRLLTFLAIPLSFSLLWMVFVLWFLYFILNMLENEWGEFKTTFYVLISIIVTIVFSMAFDFPVRDVRHFESTLFLAAAALYPNMEVSLFMLFPVKMKYLAWLTMAFVVLQFLQGAWIERLYLVAIYSNFLLFFGGAALMSVKQAFRRWQFKRRF